MDEAAIVRAQSDSDGEPSEKPDRKRKQPKLTQDEDERLVQMKTRGWRWWEIKEQFPYRTKSALQQRWSAIHQTMDT